MSLQGCTPRRQQDQTRSYQRNFSLHLTKAGGMFRNQLGSFEVPSEDPPFPPSGNNPRLAPTRRFGSFQRKDR
jgi:hypothetical protein